MTTPAYKKINRLILKMLVLFFIKFLILEEGALVFMEPFVPQTDFYEISKVEVFPKCLSKDNIGDTVKLSDTWPTGARQESINPVFSNVIERPFVRSPSNLQIYRRNPYGISDGMFYIFIRDLSIQEPLRVLIPNF